MHLFKTKKYQNKNIKCALCNRVIAYDESYAGYYLDNNGIFGKPVCQDCYEIELNLRNAIDKSHANWTEKQEINDLIELLLKRINSIFCQEDENIFDKSNLEIIKMSENPDQHLQLKKNKKILQKKQNFDIDLKID